MQKQLIFFNQNYADGNGKAVGLVLPRGSAG